MALYYSIKCLTNEPLGIKEIVNPTKTLKGLSFPRIFLNDFLNLPESKQAGVYILYNTADKNVKPIIYIGQSGVDIGDRLRNHNINKDFWNYALVFIEKGDFLSLNSAHAKIIESLLIKEAQLCDIVTLDNSTGSNPPRVQDSDYDDAETWANEVIVITKLLGLSFFVDYEEDVADTSTISTMPSLFTSTGIVLSSCLEYRPSQVPVSYKFGEKTCSFESWRDFACKLCEYIMVAYGESKFITDVTSNKLFIKKKRRVFATNPADIGSPYYKDLPGGLYMLINYSAADFVRLCNQLISLYPDIKVSLIY